MFETHIVNGNYWLQSRIDNNKHEEKYEAFTQI